MTNPLYKELRDAGFEEAELERRIIQNGETVEQIYIQAADEGEIEVETGYCMCGSPVDGHGLGDGHSPVDEGLYVLDRLREQLAA